MWHAGVESGNALADVLFGNDNPSGKLTATFPRNVGQIPIYYAVKNTGRPQLEEEFTKFKSNYLDVPNSPLFPFGYGLSYTTFEYKNLKLSDTLISKNNVLEVSVEVANTGNYDGEEVVQIYVRDLVASITRPLKELKGFQKVGIAKDETKKITFVLTETDLSFYHSNLDSKAENGEFEVFVGGNSVDVIAAHFKLVD
jgi:beta-glucosidase